MKVDESECRSGKASEVWFAVLEAREDVSIADDGTEYRRHKECFIHWKHNQYDQKSSQSATARG